MLPAGHELRWPLTLLLSHSDIEAQLLAIWSEVLGLDQAGAYDHFFELGGHSLLVMRAAVLILTRLGVRIPISLIFDYPTVGSLAPHVEALGPQLPARATRPATVIHPTAAAPLSFPQRGLWFLDQVIGRHAAYLLPDAWRLRGPLDVDALRSALEAIVARHPPLTTRFEIVDGEPLQVVRPPESFELSSYDLRHLPSAERDAEVARLAAEEAERPFDLAKDVLLRASILTVAADDHVLLLTIHHIASDAWSQDILRRELAELYRARRRGMPSTLTDISTQYVDHAARQQQIVTERYEELRSYWKQQLADLPLLDLPCDRRRDDAWSDRGAEHLFDIPNDLLSELESLAVTNHVTLQMLLLAACQVLLSRYTGQSDFGIATFSAGRTDADVEDLIGLFVNTLVLRADLSGAPTFRDLLARVRTTSLSAYDHQEFPFESLVAELRPDREGGPNPLTPVAFQFLPLADAPPALDGVEVVPLPCATRRVRFDVEITLRKESTGLHGVLGYSTDIFDDETMVRFAGHYRTLLEAIVATPDSLVLDLPLLTAAERDEQLLRWSGASAPPAMRASVMEVFEAQASATPDALAIDFGGTRLTYGELNRRAGRLAVRLGAIGVRPADVVAVHLERSIELIISMVGILKAGAAYLPLDPGHPGERLSFMVRDAQATVLVANPGVPEALVRAVTHVVHPTDDSPCPASVAVTLPSETTSLAYVMYTSGSTGRPKGVAVPHQAVTRLVRDSNYVRFEAADGVAFASNPTFDAATFEVWGALLNGARLVNIDRATLLSPALLADAIRTQRITVLFLTSALFHQVAALAPESLEPLRYLVVGGDVVDPSAVRALQAAGEHEHRHLLNGYGPTENTTFSTSYEIPPSFDVHRTVPIGRPIASSTGYVFDANRALLPVGAVGELYLGGAGLALGYVNRPELTAERFVAHPFSPGERLYRTGDRVRWRTDGQLEFLGRFDRQIKLRGHRIELEEIEHAMCQHEGVSASAVLHEVKAGDARLVAYWVPRKGGHAPSADALRNHLRQSLPAYMLPSAFVALPALPFTPNGKIDREALSAWTVATPLPNRTSARDETPLERTVAAVFKEVLGPARVGPDSNFFDLGGTSLSALTLANRLSAASGRHVSVSNVFLHPRVAALAAFLDGPDTTARPSSIVEIRGGHSKPPLYFPPGMLGEVVVHDAIREELPSNQPLYTFTDSVGQSPRASSMEAIAARFCADLNAFQPEGSLCLAGYSFGGLLAYEMARVLTAQGRQVKLLAILDTGPDLSAATATTRWSRFHLFLENLPRWISEDLLRSFDRDTPARLGRSLRKLVHDLSAKTRTRQPGHSPRVEDVFDITGWSPVLYAHVENNLRILAAFRYSTYPGRVVLFRARTRPLFHAHARDLGWSGFAREVEVIEVPGNHHTMTTEPHIRVLAKKLRAAVEQ